MALPSAVLWDMDGTLVDTEPYWIEAEYALVGEHGGHWDDALAHSLVGNPLLVSAEVVRDRGGVDLELHAIVDRLMSHVTAQVQAAPPWRPGVLRLLDELAGHGVPQAMVTMSWKPLVAGLLGHLPDGLFAAVVTGDEVEHGKPHPEPYLTALARMSLLGVEPERAVAIEDSPTGLASAEAAGLATIAVPHVVPVPAAPGRRVLPSLEGLAAADLTPPAR
jgi:HAD superfamily hydrolase (TIGR01509 family)